MKSIHFLFAALVFSAGASAQTPSTPSTSAAPQAVASGEVAMTEGEVRKVDKDAEKLTLKHGPIANLDMPGMTMVFRVADPKMLDSVKPGDKVRFVADRVGGLLTVTKIEPMR
ncbi:MAG: copper-binding protein [Candidimonas sp.]|nr:MAG: copper-binding protein [Candidimonas sp.]